MIMATKRRVCPVRRKVKQLDWLMAWLVRTHNCAFCNKPLVEGYNPRDPGKCITLHHTEGNREQDRWDDLEYVQGMLPAHSACHKAYHQRERLAAAGKTVDAAELSRVRKNMARAIKRAKHV